MLHAIVEKWRVDHGQNECPTLERLVSDGEIARTSRLEDPWNHRYAIRCEGDDVRVASAGRDGRFETADDILAPERR